MHKRFGSTLLLAACTAFAGPLHAQTIQPQPMANGPVPIAQPSAPVVRGGGLPLPEENIATISVNTTERISVAPYRLYDVPRSTREEVATVQIVRPVGGDELTKLPDSFTITTSELVGATTIVLPLVKEGEERFERRIEFLVVDEVSNAYRAYLESTIRRLFPTVVVEVLVANSQTAVLNGYVDRAEYVQPIEQLVRGFLAARVGLAVGEITVVNAMRVFGAQQVQLQVVIAEVSRTKTRDLGFDFDWQSLAMDGLIGTFSSNLGVNTINGQPFTVTRSGSFLLNGFLRAIVTHQLGKILAEPVLVTTSGQPAFFNSGGEVPTLVPQGFGAVAVQYRPFGTSIRFVPTVLGDGRIRLEVRPEVSTPSLAFSVNAGGGTIPSFVNRVAETTVEMDAGQSFVIAGLVQERIQANTTKVPFIGDLPAIGWAFQNKSYTKDDLELMIIVTPYLVDALDERPCKLPGRESRIPNDIEYYLGSKFEPPCIPDPDRDHYRRHKSGEKLA
ncbi:MAG: type II and III secretion system protein family protein, partial [Planctomycetia bacterium]